MQIEWKSEKVAPYLFRQVGEWPGLRIHRARVMPGRMLEHTNALHEINVTMSGGLTTSKISSNGTNVSTKGGRGNLCVTPAGQAVSAAWEKPIDNLGMFIDPALMNRAALENGFSDGFELAEVYKKSDPLIQQIGLALLGESSSASPSGRLFTDSLIQTLTIHLLTHYGTSQPTTAAVTGGLPGFKLRRVKEFVDANLDADLGLADISAAAGLSQFHFARAFRKSTGVTPQQYLMQQRIERAKELLSNDDLPIVEVSLRTGFKNQSHFTSLFRKFTSLTPKVWRESFAR